MRRDLNALASATFDLLVIGGGIYGACVAWEAAQRGLSVALVEQADFAGATSANSLKTIHGGLRYLQHADLKRMRESVRERSALMRIAPHLVHPLPCLIPTYGHGMKGREVMTLGLLANDILSFDQNRPADPQKRIPRGRVVGREECLRLLPGVDPAGLTGGAIFYDAQAHNTERLVLAFLRSAAERGAQLANYAAVTGLVRAGGRIAGAEVEDRLSGARLTVRARSVVNTAGPWVNRLVRGLGGAPSWPEQRFAKAVNLITRPLFGEYAVGLSSKTSYQDKDAVIKTGSRFFFVAPWRGLSMIGTAYYPFSGQPDDAAVSEQELRQFVDEFNQAYPRARLDLSDVRFVHGGLVPSAGVDASGAVQLQKQYRIHDHSADGAAGLISVVGVKYTTARDIAAKVVGLLGRHLGRRLPRSATAQTPLYGGEIYLLADFIHTEQLRRPGGLSADAVRRLVLAYGSAYGDLLPYLPEGQPEALALLEAQTRYAVHEEMAQSLSDVVFRRTELGSAGQPDSAALSHCALVMGQELGWGPERVERELAAVSRIIRGAYDTGKRPADLADPAVQPLGVEAAEV